MTISLEDLIRESITIPGVTGVNDELIAYFQRNKIGSGSPEGVVTAPVGSRYANISDGTQWTKVTGTGNTGWERLASGTGTVRNIQTQRTTTGAVAGGGNAEIAVVWPTAFPNANYTVPTPGIVEATTGASALRVRHIVSKTAAQIVVRISNDDAINAKTGEINAIGIAD